MREAIASCSRRLAASESSRLLWEGMYLPVYILTSVLTYGHMLPLVFRARSR